MSTIDETGFIRTRYQDGREVLATDWQDKLPGRRTEPDTVNGRIISLQAELDDRTNSKLQFLLDSLNPFSAPGNLLFRLAPLMAKRRRGAVFSSVRLTVTADANGTTIPAGSIVSQSAGATKFATISDITVAPSGSEFVTAFATEAGALTGAAGTITVIDTPVFGWASVTNADDASIGRTQETAAQLRFRMLATSAAPGGSPLGIYTAMTELDGVTYARVYENKTDAVDAAGIPPHSIFPIVDGGTDEEIAAELLRVVAAGINYATSSDIAGPDWVSVVLQNPANLQDETVWFARPTDTNAAIVVTIETDSEFPADGIARIKDAIIEYATTWPVGKTLYSSRLYNPVNTVPGIDINSLTIDATDRIVLAAYERLVLETADITVTVV